MSASSFLQAFNQWARLQSDIEAVALVGSYARDTATESSDIDLVILTSNVDRYLHERSWISVFGEPAECREESYGRVTSVRVFYEGGLEVEYGFSTREWADAPIDAGTWQVVTAGIKVLHDPQGIISRMLRGIQSGGK